MYVLHQISLLTSYHQIFVDGPVLQRVDLLLLQPTLELHPILAGSAFTSPCLLKALIFAYRMIPEYVFDIVTGRSGKVDPATEEELPFPEACSNLFVHILS